jgi:HEPN domain-containing protein
MRQADLSLVVKQWLSYAGEDLEIAEEMLTQESRHLRHICWLSQQSAEKAIKAALISQQIEFPRTHNLTVLSSLLPAGWELKEHPLDFLQLTGWAVEARYPGTWPDAEEADAQEAVRLARAVWEAVNNDLRKFGFPV